MNISLYDFYRATAPPLPEEIRKYYIELLKTNDDYGATPLNNEYFLAGIAEQERRWRDCYAKKMMKGREDV